MLELFPSIKAVSRNDIRKPWKLFPMKTNLILQLLMSNLHHYPLPLLHSHPLKD